MPREDFYGVWRLLSFRDMKSSADRHPFGPSPSGIIVYDRSGLMTVTIVTTALTQHAVNRAEDDANKEPAFPGEFQCLGTDEWSKLFDGCLSYFGKFTVDDDAKLVIHHVEGSNRPSFVGKNLARAFRFDGDTLELRPVAPPSGAELALVWNRTS